ncbi:hypothetical protein [Ornithobacterium rhinotracheale]
MKKTRKNIGFFASLAERLSEIKHLPRWVIFSIDLGIIVFSLGVTSFLMSIWGISTLGSVSDRTSFLVMFVVSALSLVAFRVSYGVVRHSSIKDITKISLSTFVSLIVLFIILSSTYKCNFLGADNKQ